MEEEGNVFIISTIRRFCIYPDITLCINYVRKFFAIKSVMIIDLDAHQGNGHERDFKNDPLVYIIDFYNHNIYPGDNMAATSIDYDENVS